MTLTYITKLGPRLKSTNVAAQKIDRPALETHGMPSASFLFQDSQGRIQFFKETFLLTDTSMEVVLEMPF